MKKLNTSDSQRASPANNYH